MRASFVDQLRESVSWSKVATRNRLNVCWCTPEARKYRKRIHNVGHNDFLLNWNTDCKKHTANLALKRSQVSSPVLHERFISKWWLSSKIEMWKFIQNKLEKLVNSMKIDFYCRHKSEHNYSEKNRQKNARFVDDALKTRGNIHLNVETSLLFSTPIKISGYVPAWNSVLFFLRINLFIALLTRFISISLAAFIVFSLPLRQVLDMSRFLGVFCNVKCLRLTKWYSVISRKSPNSK